MADITSRTWPIIDHNRLRQTFAQFLRYGTGGNIGAACGRVGNDNFNRLDRIGLRLNTRCDDGYTKQNSAQAKKEI